MALRWRNNPKPQGLARVAAGPQGSGLYEGDIKFATVSALGGRGEARGWYWVAGWDSDVPHKNTCDDPVATEPEAKEQAKAYVKANLTK